MIGPKAYIHLDRLKQNISIVKNEIGDRNLMVIVKANGYGHGALNISSYLDLDSNIIFAVFTIDEAIELRKGGIKNSILIFCRIQKEWLELACKYKLWINACDYEDLILLSQFYDAKGYCPKIHLKFDTGMTRLGFNVTDHEKIFQFINQKAWSIAVTVASGFFPTDENIFVGIIFVTVTAAIICFPTICLWALFGSGLRKFVTNTKTKKIIEYLLAIL